MSKKQLSLAQKSKIKVLAANDMSLRKIGRAVGTHPKVVKNFLADPKTAEEVGILRLKLSDKFLEKSEKALDLIDDDRLRKSTASQLSIISGIMADKSVALRDGPGKPGVAIQINIRTNPSFPPDDPRAYEEVGVLNYGRGDEKKL